MAVQISPRRGDALWVVKVQLLRCSAECVFEIGLFRGGFGGQALEVSSGLALQRSAAVHLTGRFYSLVHCLSDAFGLARLYHVVEVCVTVRADCGGELLTL